MKVSNRSNAKWVWLSVLILFVFVAATAIVVIKQLDTYLLDDKGAISLLGAELQPTEPDLDSTEESTVVSTADTEPSATVGDAETDATELETPSTEENSTVEESNPDESETGEVSSTDDPASGEDLSPGETTVETQTPETGEAGTEKPDNTEPQPITPQPTDPLPIAPQPTPQPTTPIRPQSSQSAFQPGFEASDDKTVWTTNTKVDIFRISYVNGAHEVTVNSDNGDKLIAPGTENSYTFKLKNTGNVPLTYTVELEAYITPANLYIPLWGRLNRYDGTWIVGSRDRYEKVAALDGAHDKATLGAGKYTYYTLDWMWPYESGDDEWDTMLGNLAVDQDLTFTIVIKTRAEADTDSSGGGGGGSGGGSGGGGGGGITPPYTGDDSNLTLWIVIAAGSFGMVLLLLFYQRRDKRDQDTEAGKD